MKELDFNDNYTDLWIDEEPIFNQDEPKTIAELYCTEDENDFLTFSEDTEDIGNAE